MTKYLNGLNLAMAHLTVEEFEKAVRDAVHYKTGHKIESPEQNFIDSQVDCPTEFSKILADNINDLYAK